MGHICPTCHLPYDAERRSVELGDIVLKPETRTLSYEGKTLRLLPAQVKVMACLMREGGEAKIETIFRACARSQESNYGVVKTQISYLRTAFKNAGINIEIHSVGGRAYRLAPGPE